MPELHVRPSHLGQGLASEAGLAILPSARWSSGSSSGTGRNGQRSQPSRAHVLRLDEVGEGGFSRAI